MNDAAAAATEETKAEEATPPVPENDSPTPAEADPEEPNMAPESEAPAQAGPVVVSELTRLKAENLNLKLIGVVNRETILQQQLNDLGKERTSLNGRMQELQGEIEQEYSIDLRTHHIVPDTGLVIPRNAQPGGMDPRAAAKLVQRMQKKG